MEKSILKKRPYWYVKRFFDIVLSLILIVITLPLMLLTVILLVLNLGFPICNQYRYREGMYKKPFLMFKFRTKKMNSDDLPRRKRYTDFSYWMDKLRVNELPQLFNVLIGQMSFVGPRPFIVNEKLPNVKISEKRYLVKPGLTNLALVYGGAKVSHKQKLEFDEMYYDNFGFVQDFIILIRTPLEVIRQLKNKY